MAADILQPACPLLSLPAGLRNKIHQLVFEDNVINCNSIGARTKRVLVSLC